MSTNKVKASRALPASRNVSTKSNNTSKKNTADEDKDVQLTKSKETQEAWEWQANNDVIREQKAKERELAHIAFIAAKEAEYSNVTFVESIDQVRGMVDEVSSLTNPALYLDAEGISLSRDGPMVFLQMYIDTPVGPHTYVIDVWSLKTDATFLTPGNEYPQNTFKSILEDPTVPKMFWDCRMDSEALYAQHQISLRGVLDIQLMEVASRRRRQCVLFIRGYAKCIERDLGLGRWEAEKMAKAKSAKNLFIPELGGSWAMLTDRPIDQRILDYCAGDVRYMPKLFKVYAGWLLPKDQPCRLEGEHPLEKPADFFGDHEYAWTKKVVEESAKRVERSQGEGWNREVDNMTYSPWQNPIRVLGDSYW